MSTKTTKTTNNDRVQNLGGGTYQVFLDGQPSGKPVKRSQGGKAEAERRLAQLLEERDSATATRPSEAGGDKPEAGAPDAQADTTPDGESDDEPEQLTLLQVREGRVLHWPRPTGGGNLPIRGKAGTVVHFDDPLLDTVGRMSEETRRKHGLVESYQLDKLEPAPAGAVLTPHQNRGAQQVYDELGFEGVAYASARSPHVRPPAPRRQRTTESVPAIDGE